MHVQATQSTPKAPQAKATRVMHFTRGCTSHNGVQITPQVAHHTRGCTSHHSLHITPEVTHHTKGYTSHHRLHITPQVTHHTKGYTSHTSCTSHQGLHAQDPPHRKRHKHRCRRACKHPKGRAAGDHKQEVGRQASRPEPNKEDRAAPAAAMQRRSVAVWKGCLAMEGWLCIGKYEGRVSQSCSPARCHP
eukprot:356998-Chlamydomonas_euryale.AAC.4